MDYGDNYKDCPWRRDINCDDHMHICQKFSSMNLICENAILCDKCPEGYEMPNGDKKHELR